MFYFTNLNILASSHVRYQNSKTHANVVSRSYCLWWSIVLFCSGFLWFVTVAWSTQFSARACRPLEVNFTHEPYFRLQRRAIELRGKFIDLSDVSVTPGMWSKQKWGSHQTLESMWTEPRKFLPHESTTAAQKPTLRSQQKTLRQLKGSFDINHAAGISCQDYQGPLILSPLCNTFSK